MEVWYTVHKLKEPNSLGVGVIYTPHFTRVQAEQFAARAWLSELVLSVWIEQREVPY